MCEIYDVVSLVVYNRVQASGKARKQDAGEKLAIGAQFMMKGYLTRASRCPTSALMMGYRLIVQSARGDVNHALPDTARASSSLDQKLLIDRNVESWKLCLQGSEWSGAWTHLQTRQHRSLELPSFI